MFNRLRRVVGAALVALVLSFSPASAQSQSTSSGSGWSFESMMPSFVTDIMRLVVGKSLEDSATIRNECEIQSQNPTMEEVLQACAAKGLSTLSAIRLYFNSACFLCTVTVAVQAGVTGVMETTAQRAAPKLAALLTIAVALYVTLNIILVFLPWGLAQGVWERLIVALGAYALAMSWMPDPAGQVKMVEWVVNPIFELGLSYSSSVRDAVLPRGQATLLTFCDSVLPFDMTRKLVGGDLRDLLCSTNAVENQLKQVINGSLLNFSKCWDAGVLALLGGSIASIILLLGYGLALVLIGSFILEALFYVGLIGIFAPVLTGLVVFPFTRSMVWTSLRIVLRSGLTVTFMVILMAVVPMITGVIDASAKVTGSAGLFEEYFQSSCLSVGHSKFVSLVLAGVLIFMVTGVCRSVADALANAPGTGTSGVTKFGQIAPAIVTRAAFGVPMRAVGGLARMSLGKVGGAARNAASKWLSGGFS